MKSRLISGLMVAAVAGLLAFVPASALAGTAADAMNKLKEQADIQAKSPSASGKMDDASAASASMDKASAAAKEKAQKAAAEKKMLEKGMQMGN